MHNIYSYSLMAGFWTAFIISILCFGVSGPVGEKFARFRRTRTIMGIAMGILAILVFSMWFFDLRETHRPLATCLCLSFYYLDVSILSNGHLGLIEEKHVTKNRLKHFFYRWLCFLLLVWGDLLLIKEPFQEYILYVASAWFILEMIVLSRVFWNIYAPARKSIEENSVDEITSYITWTLKSNNILMVLGVMAAILCHFGTAPNCISMILGTGILVHLYLSMYNYGTNLSKLKAAEVTKGESVSYARVKQLAKAWMDEGGWKENGLTTDLLAFKFGSNRKYITKYFEEEEGSSFRTCINSRRIEESKRLLTETDMSIEDIASSIGYSSRNQFATLFKSIVGESPGKWKNDQLKSRPQ